MVQIIQSGPSLSELIGSAFGQGFGTALPQGIKTAHEQAYQFNLKKLAEMQKQQVAKQKLIDTASKNIPTYLKTHYEEFDNPDDRTAIEKLYKDLIGSDPSLSHDVAMEQAVQFYQQQSGKLSQKENDLKFRQSIGQYTPEERSQEKYPYGLASAVQQFPKQAGAGLLANLGLQPAETIAAASDPITLVAKLLGGKSLSPLSQKLREVSGYEALPEEARRELGLGELAASTIPVERLVGMFGRGVKGLSGLLSGAKKTKQLAEPVAIAKEVVAPIMPKVSELTPEMQATKLRIDRMAPDERIFKTKVQQDLLEKELKIFPKYAEEVAADNEYLAEKTSRILGPRALATRAQRMQYAETQLPKIQEKYSMASARVRALEDEIAANPSKIKELQPLYDSFKRSLEDSQFALKQMFANAKLGESRTGLEAMREAAQKKTIDIADKISSGEEITLAKADYNPEMIKNAQELGKKKLMPGLREGDFNTQVHDEYASVYKQRMTQLDQDINRLRHDRNLANLYQARQYEQEKDILQKMINHIDAETALHRHKMGLRELQQRQVLQKRMKALRPAEETTKLGNVRERIANMKERVSTPQGRSQAINEAASEAVKEHPEKASQIAKEKEAFEGAAKEAQDAADENRTYLEQFLGEGKIKSLKKTHDYAKRIRQSVDNLLSKVPILGKTPIGRDVLKGFASGIVDSMIPDIPVFNRVRHGTFSAVLFGRHGVGALVSLASREAIKIAISEWKTRGVTEAYRNRDREKIAKYTKDYSPKIMKEAKKRAFSRSG